MKTAPERILVVDDEVSTLTLFQRILEKEGYEVVCATSGEEALQQLASNWFDLAISDLRMPGLTGIELVREAKALNPTLPCIVLTGYGTVHSAVAAMKEGAYDYLTKPVNDRSEEHTSELQSRPHLVCRLLLEKKKRPITN